MAETSGKNKKFDAIVCLSGIDWDFLWQRTQEIMSQFAMMGYPVLFVENTGVRIPGIKDGPRVWKRFKKIVHPQEGTDLSKSHNNIKVLSPMALPFPYSQSACRLNSALIRAEIARFSKNVGVPVNRILLWSYMTTPLAVDLAESLPWAGVVVDLVSDPCKVPGAERIVPYHRKMLQKANVVFCASVSVMDNAKKYVEKSHHSKVKLFEDGFSINLYNMAQNGVDLKLPVKNPDNPIVVYIGGVNSKIWWDAVSVMAERVPDVNFVFIGPKEYGELPCKGAGQNVIWLPPFEKHSQLGAFLKKCSAGLIPYISTPYVNEMRPAKINEYMVMGLPIVGTRMPELERLAVDYGPGIVYMADSIEEFEAVLRRALNHDGDKYRDKRKEITCARSWERICKELMYHRLHQVI
ncbi:glycosyltransferase [Phosphitispora sp. TUW77]|uniref:glycosyltransferase n=1 Tax=Phosphitispora sp. TUW77 TaxID=3152361 RepID=UPI003AB70411